MIEKIDSSNTSTNTIASISTKEDILGALTANEDSDTMLKDKLTSLIKIFVEVYNAKNEDKISDWAVSSLVEGLLKFDKETIMNSLILRIVQWVNTGKLSKDDVLEHIDLLLAIDPENFKSVDDVIARYNYLRCIGLDKVQLKKNCSEILKENHEYVYELFDNFNALVNNEELSGLDYWYTWWLVGYFWTNSELKRYHWDVDIYLNVDDLDKLRRYIEEHKESGFRFIDNLKNKGLHGHEYMITYKDNPLHIWLFLFRKKNESKIKRVEYDLNKEWELEETVSYGFPYDVEEWEYNNRKYRRESLEAVISYKKNSNREKDKFDVNEFMKNIDK